MINKEAAAEFANKNCVRSNCFMCREGDKYETYRKCLFFAVEADCKRKNGHGRRRARQYGRITKPRQAAGLLGFVAEGYTVSV